MITFISYFKYNVAKDELDILMQIKTNPQIEWNRVTYLGTTLNVFFTCSQDPGNILSQNKEH